MGLCVTSLTKRRTRADISELLGATNEIIKSEPGQITIRHLFYRLVSLGLVPKTENGYKGLDRFLMVWRRAEQVPWGAFVDNTRWQYGGQTYTGLEEALAETARTYRKTIWTDLPDRVEIWTEKDAIAGILMDEADKWGVPVLPTRGFPSGTMLFNAAVGIRNASKQGKATTIYYFGDHDPSGVMIDGKIRTSLTKDFGVSVDFSRVAVSEDQIERYDLPTRATKKSTHSKNFKGGSVEIDAMPMQVLRDLVEDAIIRHIDPGVLEKTQRIEREERATLEELVGVFSAVGGT